MTRNERGDHNLVSQAREFGITLIGLLRADRLNVYTGLHRVHLDQPLVRNRTEEAYG